MADTCYTHKPNASGNCTQCGKACRGTNAHVVAAFEAANVTMDRNGNTREARDLIRSGNGNLASVRDGRLPATFLQSYGVAIAIRRDSDGAIFLNGHSYSPSTGRHQREAGATWQDGLSFVALTALLGPAWYETANVVEHAPQSCRSEHCEAKHKADVDAWQAMSYSVKVGERVRPNGYASKGRVRYGAPKPFTEDVFEQRWKTPEGTPLPYPDRMCLFPNIERETSYSRERMLEEAHDPQTDAMDVPRDIPADILQRGQHELTGDASGQAFTLLSAIDPLGNGRSTQVICGFERGKSDGRGDQLWAAICPINVSNVLEALDSLNPFAKGSRTDTGARRDETVEDVKRQGDLFFAPFAGECPCPCHVVRYQRMTVDGSDVSEQEAERNAQINAALARAGILNRDGSIRKGHGCTRAGENAPQLCKRRDSPPANAVRLDGLELPDQGGRHVATRAALTARNVRFAQGQIQHPEHRTLMLKTWHRVARSLAVRAMSARYRQGWTGGRGYAD
jgi:hypothetical protein